MKLLLLALVVFLAGCDNSQAIHAPDPKLNRMLQQARLEPYRDPMRVPPAGAIPYDFRRTEEPPVDRELLAHGRERYDTICATCHGVTGDGVSVVATKMQHRPPPSFLDPRVLALSPPEVVRVIAEGYGFMPGYAAELPARDRWAVAAYVRALQLSRKARVAELPPDVQRKVAQEAK